MADQGERNLFGNAVVWAAKHLLATWGVLFSIVMIVKAVFGWSGSIGDIWFMTSAPFMFMIPVAKLVGAEYGEIAGNTFWVGSVTAIYILLDIVLWTVIRSVRRANATLARIDDKQQQQPQPASRMAFGLVWLGQHWFSLWAVVTAIALFTSYEFRIDFYAPNIKGLITYGGIILALPILPFLAIASQAGLEMQDPVSRGIALSCFVIACIVLEFEVKRRRRRLAMARESQSSAN